MSTTRLAVVTAVLAALAAVGYATMARTGEATKKIGSARNLQQWGIALNLYLIDNQSQLPEPGSLPISPEQKQAWYNALPPYISQPPLAEIPPGERPRPGVPSLWIDPAMKPVRAWDPEVFYFHYGMNEALQPDPALRSFRIYEVPHPGNVIFLTEVDSYKPSAEPADVAFRHGEAKPGSPQASAHILFCDGHVQTVPKAVLLDDPRVVTAAAAEDGISWFRE